MNTTADSLVTLAARVDAIQPFYVMELMKQAQQLEAAGRDIIHMGIGCLLYTSDAADDHH